jgi:hypothetical protein
MVNALAWGLQISRRTAFWRKSADLLQKLLFWRARPAGLGTFDRSTHVVPKA